MITHPAPTNHPPVSPDSSAEQDMIRSAAAAIPNGVQVTARELARLLRCEVTEDPALDRITFCTRRIAQGDALYRTGDEFHSLYVVRSGFLKTVMFDPAGTEQVLGFPMQADVIGADGLASGRYASEPIALEGSEVIVLPFGRITALAREFPMLEQLAYRTLSRELVREQGMLYILGTLGAEGRVAAFLLNLSERFGALGYSRTAFNLRMTRQEIGSYLGLKLETVSRALSALDAAGIVRVQQKRIDLVDMARLREALEEPGAALPIAGRSRRASTKAAPLRGVRSPGKSPALRFAHA